jgi:hypothetical protein
MSGWTQWTVEDGTPPPVPGFIASSFSPLVAAVATRCLTAQFGEPPAPAGERTAVVLVSRHGDEESAAAVAEAVDAGDRIGPLLFFQSVPNAIAGHVAARWGLGGPVVCVSPPGDPVAAGTRLARLLIADGDADRALLVLVDGGTARATLVGGPA